MAKNKKDLKKTSRKLIEGEKCGLMVDECGKNKVRDILKIYVVVKQDSWKCIIITLKEWQISNT